MDWAMMEDEETWRDVLEMLAHVNTFILGRKMYPAYEQYWLAMSSWIWTKLGVNHSDSGKTSSFLVFLLIIEPTHEVFYSLNNHSKSSSIFSQGLLVYPLS
jgi:hypothetical protein